MTITHQKKNTELVRIGEQQGQELGQRPARDKMERRDLHGPGKSTVQIS